MKKHASSIDVAKRAGVSQTTVSFVLNNRADQSISDETRARVMAAARDLSYRSNRLSHGIFRGSTGLIGVVMPQVTQHYYSRILHGILAECGAEGPQVLLTSASFVGDTVTPLDRLIEYRVDSVICLLDTWGTPLSEEWLHELLEKRIPCVILDDHSHEDVVDCVVNNDVEAAQEAVLSLVARGHRRIAHLAAGHDITTAVDRRIGYTRALEMSGIALDDELIAGYSYDLNVGAEAARYLLNQATLPTAIFAANDGLASAAIKVARAKGLECPRELSIIGYGNTAVADAMDLTSIDQDPSEIGAVAVRQVAQRALHPDNAPALYRVPCRMVERSSVRDLNAS